MIGRAVGRGNGALIFDPAAAGSAEHDGECDEGAGKLQKGPAAGGCGSVRLQPDYPIFNSPVPVSVVRNQSARLAIAVHRSVPNEIS